MHYLITGGAGFIGYNLTKMLSEKGHQVTIVDNLSSDMEHNLPETSADLVIGDVRDETLMNALVKQADYIVHLASVVGIRRTQKNRLQTVHVGVIGTENIMQAATRYEKEVFLASSSAVYGKIEQNPVPEDADCRYGPPTNPSWVYSATKLIQEQLAIGYHKKKGTDMKIGRFFNVTGPLQTPSSGMVVPTFVSKCLNDEPILVFGDGKQTRTFVDVNDAVRGAILVCQKGQPGTPYNIGGSREISIMQLAKKIRNLTDSKSDIKKIPYRQVYGEDYEETRQRRPDISRLQQLGYHPRADIDQILKRVIRHQRSQG